MITYEQYLKLNSKYLSRKASTTTEEKDQIWDFEMRQPMGYPHCNSAVWTPSERPRIAHDIDACGKTMKPQSSR